MYSIYMHGCVPRSLLSSQNITFYYKIQDKMEYRNLSKYVYTLYTYTCMIIHACLTCFVPPIAAEFGD